MYGMCMKGEGRVDSLAYFTLTNKCYHRARSRAAKVNRNAPTSLTAGAVR